jgi:hypothetical protein
MGGFAVGRPALPLGSYAEPKTEGQAILSAATSKAMAIERFSNRSISSAWTAGE